VKFHVLVAWISRLRGRTAL